MKYKVYIEDGELLFENERGNLQAFDVDDIYCFTATDIKTDLFKLVPMGKVLIHVPKKNPITYGTILICFKTYAETKKEKKDHLVITNEYATFSIKKVADVFGLAEKLIDLGFNYDDVPIRDVIKINAKGKVFYSKKTSISYNGKIITTNIDYSKKPKALRNNA